MSINCLSPNLLFFLPFCQMCSFNFFYHIASLHDYPSSPASSIQKLCFDSCLNQLHKVTDIQGTSKGSSRGAPHGSMCCSLALRGCAAILCVVFQGIPTSSPRKALSLFPSEGFFFLSLLTEVQNISKTLRWMLTIWCTVWAAQVFFWSLLPAVEHLLQYLAHKCQCVPPGITVLGEVHVILCKTL